MQVIAEILHYVLLSSQAVTVEWWLSRQPSALSAPGSIPSQSHVAYPALYESDDLAYPALSE